MTIAYLALLVAAMLPFVCAGISKAGRRDYDNRSPREWMETLHGYRRRADAAQSNSWEALPFFAAAVIIAHQLGAEQGWLDALAVAFVLLRMVYVWLYVRDRSTLRSVVWTAALAVNVWIFFLGA